jgi:hypothetical protein
MTARLNLPGPGRDENNSRSFVKSSRGRQGRSRASAKLHQHQHQRLRVRANYCPRCFIPIPTCLCDAAAFSSHSLPSSLPTLLFMLRNIVNHHGLRHLSFAGRPHTEPLLLLDVHLFTPLTRQPQRPHIERPHSLCF